MARRSSLPTRGAALLGLLMLQSLLGCASSAQLQDGVAAGASSLEWVVECRPGEDGFASNCVATADAPPFVLRLSTADSQLSVSSLHLRHAELVSAFIVEPPRGWRTGP